MAKVRIVLDEAQVRAQLLKSPEIRAECEEAARRMAAAAGNGYETDAYSGTNRINVSVYPATPEAVEDNFTNNTLEKVARMNL